jgi:hypothetical protein
MSYRMSGTDFVKEFKSGEGDRDKYYARRFGKNMGDPKGVGVPKESGIQVDELGRIFVTLSDDKEQIKMDIDDAVYKVEKLLRDKGIKVFPNGNGSQ